MNDNNYKDQLIQLNELYDELNDELNDEIENLKFMLIHNDIHDINLYKIYIHIDELINKIDIVENKIIDLKILNI